MPIRIRIRLTIFNADPDPDQDPEQDPSLSFTNVGKPEKKTFLLLFQAVQVYSILLYLSGQRHRCHIFNIFRKKYILAFHLVEMDMGPDPDRQALDADPGK